MSLFLLVIFLLYGGMHFHAYRKFSGAFTVSLPVSLCIVLFMGVMVCAPVLVRVAEREGLESIAIPLATAGYLWMGFLFLFFSTSVLLDGGRFLLKVSRVLPYGCHPTDRQTFLASLFISFVVVVHGYREAGKIRTEKVTIRTEKLPPWLPRLTIVQISDVHLGLMVREKRLHAIARAIENAHPHLLVSTGDLVDGQRDGMEKMAAELRNLKPPYGKFAVTGNHEWYAGIGPSLDFTRRAGFFVLRGQNMRVGEFLHVAGFDDPMVERSGSFRRNESDILGNIPRNEFTVVLKHRPVVDKQSIGLFDIQLSGHVHKGQIFPFGLVTRLVYPVSTGLSRCGDSLLYVSRGTGTWGPPIRFLAPPEVTVIELVHGKTGS